MSAAQARQQIAESEIVVPLCPYCLIRAAQEDRPCSRDNDIVCRCCAECRTRQCRSSSNDD